jgi:hypothetical protein
VPTPAKSRQRRLSHQDSLRPGWVVNCILFCVLLAGIGGCYVWLGAKKKHRADQILSLRREIDLITAQIEEKEMQISQRLAPESLRTRAESAGLDLQPIDIGPKGRFFRLPDPIHVTGHLSEPPALAGNPKR